MTTAVVVLALAVALLAVALFVLLRILLTRPHRHILVGVLSTDETISNLHDAVDDLRAALADDRIEQSAAHKEQSEP